LGNGSIKRQQTLDQDTWNAVTAAAVEIVDGAHLKRRIEAGDHLRVKLGLDPTKPDIHLGHTVPLRALQRYQAHGHQAILIIGDWTARIGDPSGQNVTRPQLTKQEVEEAAKTYLDQAWKILEKGKTEVRFQSEWFDKMRLEEVVQLTSRYTVARMLAREDFAKRMKENRPVSLHETLYPLLQAFDSVAVRSDLELGGTDQTFNLLVDTQYAVQARRALLEIFQREKEWRRAIKAAEGLQESGAGALNKEIAQFYCELAQDALTG